MAMTEVSKEYASALFMLACEKEKRSEYKEALMVLKDAFLKEPEYLLFLASPSIPLSERQEAIKSAFSGRVPEDVLSYLLLLCEKGRIDCFLDSVEEFCVLFDASEKVMNAKVTSAVELSEEEKQKLLAKLEKMSKTNVNIEYTLDPSILGGLVVEMDGRVLDGSLKSRLRDIKDVMNG